MTERELLQRTKQFALRIFKRVGVLPQIETDLFSVAQVASLLDEASEIFATVASSKETAAKSQIANRKSAIR
jgi:hypothetical protein